VSGRTDTALGALSIDAVVERTAAALARAGIEDARAEARRLVGYALGKNAAFVFAHPEWRWGAREDSTLAALVARRAGREPLSRILGAREFWSLEFRLSPDTLDPRPESETLVEALLDAVPDRAARLNVLDLGTGSGCLLLALLSELPNAWGLGIDLAPGAAATALLNAARLGLGGRACFAVGDWAAAIGTKFDLVAVNPPYVAEGTIAGLEPEVANWDPILALAAGADGLGAIRALASHLPKIVSDQGIIAMEVGAGQEAAAARIASAAGLEIIARKNDLSGVPRCLLMRPAKAG